ncbi:MAG: MFS transporter [Woeseiaceae bacterium]|nr:MFS transporter [Woeseiaceae bacterium]
MRSALLPVAALLFGVSLLLAGQGLQATLLPVRASLESFSALSIGLMGGTYFLGFTLGCLKGGELVIRVGHVRVFAAMTALASATPLLHGLVLGPLIWAALRLVTGFCFAVLYVVIESWLNDVSTNENRGTVFSVYTMISLTVLALGQMMLLLNDPAELYLFALASVLVSIAVVPVVLSTAQGPQQPHSVRLDIPRLYRISPAGTLGCLGAGLANGAFWALAPAFTLGLSANYGIAAWFMTASVLGGALAQGPVGHLSDRIGRRTVLAGCAVVGSIVAVIIVLMANTLPVTGLVLLGGAWGACAFPMYPLAVANANDYAQPAEYVMVSSGLLLMYGLGAIAGPLLASIGMTLFDYTGLYVYTAAVHVLLAAYMLIRINTRAWTPDEEHVDFSESMLAAHTKSQIYEEESQALAARRAADSGSP